MVRTVNRFQSFEEADKADAAYYRSLTPNERVDILLELVKQMQPRNEAEQRLKRVHRTIKLSES